MEVEVSEARADPRASEDNGAERAHSTTTEPAKRAVWTPRWRTDPDAKGVPYRPQGSRNGRSLIPPGPGEYRARGIADRIGGSATHSFWLKEVVSTNLPGQQGLSAASDSISAASERQKLIAIVYHRGAHPASDHAVGDSRELWTRHNFEAIQANVGTPLPFFVYSTSPQSEELWRTGHTSFYVYAGTYAIKEARLVRGKSAEVVEFLKAREESTRDRSAELWRDKLNSDWLRVRVEKCAESEQLPDPMLQ